MQKSQHCKQQETKKTQTLHNYIKLLQIVQNPK